VHDASTEFADPDQVRALQWSKLDGIIQRTHQTNPFYRGIWEAAGVDVESVRNVGDFQSALPWVDKSMFLADQMANPPAGTRISTAIDPGEALEYYTTSGTSGRGSELHAQTTTELAAMVDMYRYGFTWAGLTAGEKMALTLPITMLAGGRVEYQAAVGFGMSVRPIGNYDAERKLEVIRQFAPTSLFGSTTYFAHLAAVSDEPVGNSSVRTLLTGLEGVGLSYVQRLEEAWGAQAFDRFGCAQMRADFLFSCEHGFGSAGSPGVLHAIDPFVLVEVLDPVTGQQVADGEYGEIFVTSLYHRDTPLIRCRLYDGGIYRAPGSCACGRSFSGIEVGSIGRTDGVKKIKGVNVYPQAVDKAIFSVPGVEEYHIRLFSKGEADVAQVTLMLAEGEAGSPAKHAEAVAESLRHATGLRFDVVIGHVERSEYKVARWTDERSRD
jgi:phenylacetate-CoA ligase